MVDLSTTQRGGGGGNVMVVVGYTGGFVSRFCYDSLVGIFPIRLSSKHTEGLGAFLEGSQPPWVMAL